MPKAKLRLRVCKECGKEYLLGVDSTQHKYCSEKCRASFHNKNGGKKYRHSEKGKLASRSWRLRKKFNITIEEFNSMLYKQNGRCSICKTTEPTGYNWHVDHDHKTGLVRGLLCSCCNQGLGLFKDNINNLQNVIQYLKSTSNTH